MAGRQPERPTSHTITPYLQETSPEREVPPLPPKKKARKNAAMAVTAAPVPPPPPSPEVVSDSEEEEDEVVVAHGFTHPGVEIVQKANGKRFVRQLPPPQEKDEEEEDESPGTSQAGMVVNPRAEPLVSAWEKGMELMAVLMEKYHVEPEEKAAFKFLPEQSNVYRKICKTWLNEEHRGLQLTFTSQKTFVEMMGRFLRSYVETYAGVKPQQLEPTGCAVWLHGCTDQEGVLRCYHGLEMIQKEQLVEMDVGSENGQRALKEHPGKTKVVQNRWGRSVVQLKNDDARCCVEDVSCGNNVFSPKSCGLFFTEGTKAQTAFKQMEAFMQADYPKMQHGQKRLLIAMRCDCLNQPSGVPVLGRQLCKMTAFALSNAETLRGDEVTDKTALASIHHPSVLVFQCANPVYRNSRGSQGPNCDFKISAPDLLGALQLVRKLWGENVEGPLPKLLIPEFKWNPRLQYRNVSLPTSHGDEEAEPF
ncbi:DBP [Simian adenovirus 17]|uniref:DNA-binding protein n=1 Tax=Simian adenovirus 17 TaxID=1715779 RepID=A0A2H4CJW6_9ADEN|nr:DBP [Simian adenovirus 17]